MGELNSDRKMLAIPGYMPTSIIHVTSIKHGLFSDLLILVWTIEKATMLIVQMHDNSGSKRYIYSGKIEMRLFLLEVVFAQDGAAMILNAASGISARQMKGSEPDAVKLVVLFFVVAFMMLPPMLGNGSYQTDMVDAPATEMGLAANENLLTIELTAQSDHIATGIVDGMDGFAYSDDLADYLRFVDPIHHITLNQSVEAGTLEEKTITGVDIDGDLSTEFLILNYNGSDYNLLIVDFNDALTTAFNLSISDPTGISAGDFNGDTYPDVAVFIRYGVVMLDLHADQLLGNFSVSVGDSISSCAIGRFLESSQDSVALGIWPSTKIANLSIVAGNGTLMKSIIFDDQIWGITSFDHGSGLDDLAAMAFDGNLTALSPDTMSMIFNTTGLPSRSIVMTGILNNDGQEDLLVAPTIKNHSVFIDGIDGAIIRQSVDLYGCPQGPISGDSPSSLCGQGLIDADDFTDYALLASDGKPGFLRGADGTIGYEEPTIPDKPDQVLAYDINNSNRDDILILHGQVVYVMLTDVHPPIIIPKPLSPTHPTIRDLYVTLEVGIEEETPIIRSDIYVRHDYGNWSQPDQLQSSGTEYFAFLVGLPEGFYEYYLVFQDMYLNIGTLGNETYPMNFTVAGNLVWSESRNLASGLSHHLMDIGNASDGSEVIYILDSSMAGIIMERYTPRGENQTVALVADNTFSDFWIYTGMMDGDNILDPIALLYDASAGKINVSIYHGSSGTLWFSAQYPHLDFRAPLSAQTYDCDSDGVDEFFFVTENGTSHEGFLARLRADGSWSEVKLTGTNAESYGLALASTVNDHSVEACISASTGPVDIVNATSMGLISTHNVTSTDHMATLPAGTYAFRNASQPRTRFMLYLFFLDPTGYSCGFQVFDANTPKINETKMFTNSNGIYFAPTLIDVDSDGTDEILGVNYFSKDLTLFRLTDPVTIEWEVPMSSSDILSTVVVDFDGDTQDEIGVFTKQDEQLRIVSLDGIIERVLTVGQGYGPMRLSNIDLGYGEEIVVYPLVQEGVAKIGVIRDVNLIRQLNASLTYSSGVISQGDSLAVFVGVTNIYSETISDAEVYLTVHYLSGTSIINQTKALIFGMSNYSTSMAINWPMGVVNFSLVINHELYDIWEEYYANALIVRSTLGITIHTRDIVMQNSTFSANITVTDSLGARVPDATVAVSLGETKYAATYQNTQYRLLIPNIALSPGSYLVNASADHTFSEHTAYALAVFRLETDEINIAKDMPAVLEQDERFTGWLNISDIFGNPIHGALVRMISGNHELTLEELSPGCYFLNATPSLSIGNHAFDIFVEQEFIQGVVFGDVQIVITGDLVPEVPELPPVDGGSLFNVTVFIYDMYGIAPGDAWVTIGIDGRNVTATQLSTGRFRALLNATYAAGDWNFTVYYGSVYSHEGKKVYDLRVYSDPIIRASSSNDWIIGQGNSTTIEVHIEDWLHIAVEDASVNLLVRGTTYTLAHVGEGLYQRELSTVGWPYGAHTYYIAVDHEFLYQAQISGNLTVIAKPSITITPSSQSPAQFDSLVVTIEVKDLYKNPVTGLMVMVGLSDYSLVAQETAIGVYSATIDLGNIHHGSWNITVSTEGALSVEAKGEYPIFVNVYIPSFSLSAYEVSVASGLALLLSFIGMILFVKVASVVTTAPRKSDDVTRSIAQLDRIYGIIVVASGALFIHSWILYLAGTYIYALVESVILLGASVLLYGIWLYRDAYSSILLRGSLSKRRVALGTLHLVLVPFIVFLIFYYGYQLETFQQYVVEVQHIIVGGIDVIPLEATVLATYLSSIVVVVISFYREIRKGLNRIDSMISSGTPKNVVDEEQALLIGRTGSSIRIKFLMFLLILGATTVMQLDFILKNYSIAAIVLIPVVFLVLIPFVSSRIVRGISGMTRRPVGEESGGYAETTEVGIE